MLQANIRKTVFQFGFHSWSNEQSILLPAATEAQREQEVIRVRRWQKGHRDDLLPYALWDICNYCWRSPWRGCDPFLQSYGQLPILPWGFFSSERGVNLCSPLIFGSGVWRLSVVLATQAVRKLWRWIGFRSDAFTPVGQTAASVYFFPSFFIADVLCQWFILLLHSISEVNIVPFAPFHWPESHRYALLCRLRPCTHGFR